MTQRKLLVLWTSFCWTLVCGLMLLPRPAAAAPVSVGGKVGTGGASGRASGGPKGFELPKMVIGGNAVSLLMPVQVGFAGYLPRVRIALQYDRQLYKSHWFYVQAAALMDRAGWQNFRLPDCGLGGAVGTCNPGTVAGFDVGLGYAHKWYLESRPWLVPIARVGVNGGAWWYPFITESRQQSRERSWTLNVRAGGGVRIFLLRDLALGFDLNLALGFLIHKDRPLAKQPETNASFLLGMEILPLIVEYRF